MAKEKNQLFLILAMVAMITCCNSVIVAAGTPGIMLDKKKYIKSDGGFISLTDVTKNIMIIVCFLSVPLIIGFIYLYTHLKKSGSDDDDDDDDDDM